MPSPSSTLVPGLAVTAAATLIAGVVSAFAVGGGSPSTTFNAESPGSTTSVPGLGTIASGEPTTAGGPSLAPGKPGSTATTTTPAAPTTAAPVSTLPAASGPVGDPGQLAPEAPGRYTYSYSASSGSGDGGESGTLTETVQTTSSSGGVTRQSVADTGPQSATQNRVVEWRPAGLFEIQRDFNFNGQSAQCTWNPALHEIVSPLAIGRQWTFAGSCQVIVYGQPLTVKLNGSAKVTGRERLKVGADSVDVWVIPSDTTVVGSNPGLGTFTFHSVATTRLAGRLGLLVEQDGTTTASSQGGTKSATTHMALKSIHPS